jgi:hypothetical protein
MQTGETTHPSRISSRSPQNLNPIDVGLARGLVSRNRSGVQRFLIQPLRTST